MTRIPFQLAHDTAALWTSNNPTLAAGEAGVETDTHKIKVGDGSTTWSSLAYAGGSGGSGTVTTLSVASTNGFSGSVANPTTTPAITLSTSISGLLKGSSGALVAASSGTDYQAPYTNLTSLGSLANSAGWLYNSGSGTLSYSTPTAANVGAQPLATILTTLAALSNTAGYLYNNGVGTLSYTSSAYTLPTATNSILGGVKPDGTSILNSSGVISATPASIGAQPLTTLLTTFGSLASTAGYLYNNGSGVLSYSASTYTLPAATSSVLGGVKPDGSSILNSSGVISATAASVGALASGGTAANSSQLLGGTWAIPGTIGSTTPAAITGTTITGTLVVNSQNSTVSGAISKDANAGLWMRSITGALYDFGIVNVANNSYIMTLPTGSSVPNFPNSLLIQGVSVPTLATGYLSYNGSTFSWATPGGSGTVTSVSTAAANNGVTATWSMASPTPALTIGLGAITPTSVAATSTISGTTITSTVATGTAPLTVTSTTVCANLHAANSDSLGGTAAASYALLASPSFTTPTLGAALATSINKVAITAPTTSATLTLVTGSTLSTVGAYALALTTTAASTPTFPAGAGTLAYLAGTNTWSGVNTFSAGILPNVSSPSWAATMTLTTTGFNVIRITLAGATTLNFSAGQDGQRIVLELKQDTTGSRIVTWGTGIAWGTDFTSITLTTTISKTDEITLVYNSTAAVWRIVGFARGF